MTMMRGVRRRVLLAVIAVLAALIATIQWNGTASSASPAAETTSQQTSTTCSAGTGVETTNGPVCGLAKEGYRQWLGIPYAAPPVGALRWRSPQPVSHWASRLAATENKSACPQLVGAPGASDPSTNEDCLYLNVTTPKEARGQKLPVMVLLHGGGFTGGSSAIYDGSHLATTGKVVNVVMNYRLGIFGFFADNDLGQHSGDYGLQDQQAALRWVRHNIANFGGDPHNVTIFGFSAGGSSVCDQLASPTAAGLFDKAISMSGEYNSTTGAPTALQPQDCKANLPNEQQADLAGAAFAASAGCGGAPSALACLRRKSAADLLSVPGGTLAPIVNGTTLTMQPWRAFQNGDLNKKPTLLGVGRDENLAGTATTASDYRTLINTQYGPSANAVMSKYPLGRYPSPFIAYRTVAADSNTVCPNLRTATRLSRWVPTYVYEGDDGNAPPSVYQAGQGTALPWGDYHVTAVQYLYPSDIVAPLNANDQVLATQTVDEFASFAYNSNPTATGAPIWPQYQSHRSIMSMEPAGTSHVITATQIRQLHNCSFWATIRNGG